jgi:hypothetical protein
MPDMCVQVDCNKVSTMRHPIPEMHVQVDCDSV